MSEFVVESYQQAGQTMIAVHQTVVTGPATSTKDGVFVTAPLELPSVSATQLM